MARGGVRLKTCVFIIMLRLGSPHYIPHYHSFSWVLLVVIIMLVGITGVLLEKNMLARHAQIRFIMNCVLLGLPLVAYTTTLSIYAATGTYFLMIFT